MITDDTEIHTIDIFSQGKIVASIITSCPTNCIGSNDAFFNVQIGDNEVIISAEKIQIS